jgi:hypothetical protein
MQQARSPGPPHAVAVACSAPNGEDESGAAAAGEAVAAVDDAAGVTIAGRSGAYHATPTDTDPTIAAKSAAPNRCFMDFPRKE